MSEEIEDNDNLEPDDRASTEPPTVFAAGQTAGNLPKKTANKLDWMMPDYADEDARGEGKAIAGLAAELQSTAAQTVSAQGVSGTAGSGNIGENVPGAHISANANSSANTSSSANSPPPAVRKAPPVTFAEEFQQALQSAPALDLQQMHQPEELAQLQQEQALLQQSQSGAQAVLPQTISPAVPAPLHVDHSQHQSIDEFKAAPSSIHFLKPPEGRVLPPEPDVEESATQFVPLPDLPRSLDARKLDEAGPITPAPVRPVYSKKSDGSEKLVSPDRLQQQGQPADSSAAFAPAIGQSAQAAGQDAPAAGHDAAASQRVADGAHPDAISNKPGYAPPAPNFAAPPADYESQHSQSQSANRRESMQSSAAQAAPSASSSPSSAPDYSSPSPSSSSLSSAPDSSSPPPSSAPRRSRLPRSIAPPEDDEAESEPVPHARSFRKLPPSRTSDAPLPIERSLQSPSSKVAIIIAVSVLVGVGVGVGFLANIKKPADTEGPPSGIISSMPAGRSSTARTIDTASLLGTKSTGGEPSATANFAPVNIRDLKNIDEAREAGAKQLLAGNYEGARKCYTAALAFDAHDMTSLHKRGLSNYLLGNYAVALVDLNKVLERDHRYIPALLDRAAAYYKLGEYKKAQADYDLLFAVDRGNRFALLGLSLCKSKQNLSEEALKTLSRLTFGDPGYVGGYEAAGYEFLKTGDYQRAAVAFSKALNVAPNSDSIYALRARSYLLAGDKAHAIDDYNKAIELCKNPASLGSYKQDLAVAQSAN